MKHSFNIRGILMILVFLPVFLMQSWRIPMVYAWYYANETAIAYQFCINKNKPELKCSGKCYVRKVIQEYEASKDDWKSLATKSIKLGSIILIKENYSSIFSLFINKQVIKPSFIYLFNYLHSVEKTVFHPPQLFL